MRNLQDQQLATRVSQYKDQDAFAVLHSQYFIAISKFIMLRIAQKEDVDDLVSQVFLKIWKYLTKAPAKKMHNFRAFLYKIARNEIANFYRVQGRIPQMVELDAPEEYLEIADPHEDIFQQKLQDQDANDLVECVQKLPEPYREIIALRFFEELEIKEIAEIIDKTLGNTNVLIHRGVRALRKIMQSSN